MAFAFFLRSFSLAFFNSDSGTVFFAGVVAAGTFLSVGALVWGEHETKTRFKLFWFILIVEPMRHGEKVTKSGKPDRLEPIYLHFR